MNPVRIGDATLYTGDVLEVLRSMADESVHCVVTSPPYWGLRDYGITGQIGLEASPEEYVAKMVEVFREVRRVLRSDGTAWVNLGASYAGSGKGPSNSLNKNNPHSHEAAVTMRGMNQLEATPTEWMPVPAGFKPKDMIPIPWMVAMALQADGWYLRSDIIWAKPNPMPESVTDRPTKAHEYLFLLSKSARYFYDADAVREAGTTTRPELLAFGDRPDVQYPGHVNDRRRSKKPDGWDTGAGGHGSVHRNGREHGEASEIRYGRNRRTVWTVATAPYKDAHFATFPPKLIEPCILAGCPEHACPKCGAPWVMEVEREPSVKGGIGPKDVDGRTSRMGHGAGWRDLPVARETALGEHPTCACGLPSIGGTVLDPFGGSGTTAAVALEYGRRAILIELKPEYVEMQKKRLRPVAGRPLLAFGGTG